MCVCGEREWKPTFHRVIHFLEAETGRFLFPPFSDLKNEFLPSSLSKWSIFFWISFSRGNERTGPSRSDLLLPSFQSRPITELLKRLTFLGFTFFSAFTAFFFFFFDRYSPLFGLFAYRRHDFFSTAPANSLQCEICRFTEFYCYFIFWPEPFQGATALAIHNCTWFLPNYFLPPVTPHFSVFDSFYRVWFRDRSGYLISWNGSPFLWATSVRPRDLLSALAPVVRRYRVCTGLFFHDDIEEDDGGRLYRPRRPTPSDVASAETRNSPFFFFLAFFPADRNRKRVGDLRVVPSIVNQPLISRLLWTRRLHTHRTLSGLTGCQVIDQLITKFYRVWSVFTVFFHYYLVYRRLNLVSDYFIYKCYYLYFPIVIASPSFTWFYLVLPGFTWFYRVLPGYTGITRTGIVFLQMKRFQ